MAIINLTSIDLNHLVFLEALFDERNLTRAAAKIGLGQPSASKALNRLRLCLEDELFVRIPGGMRPTQRAEQIEPGIRLALQEIRKALSSGTPFEPGTAKGTVRIATSDIVTLTFLPQALARLKQKAPGLDIRIRNLEKDSAFEDLDSGRIDFVIGVFDELPKRFVSQIVITDKFAVIAPKASGYSGRISLEDYSASPHILFTLRDDAQGAVDEALAKFGKKRRVALTVGHVLAVPALVAETGFLATISANIALRLGPQAGCVILKPPIALKPWVQKLIWPRAADGNPLLKFVHDEIVAVETNKPEVN